MAMEHRWGPRRPTNVRVRVLAHAGAVGAGRVLNVSSTGAYLLTNLPLKLLSVIYLEPPIADGFAGRPRRCAAGIVRHDSQGVGVEWCNPSAEVADLFSGSVDASPADRDIAAVNVHGVP